MVDVDIANLALSYLGDTATVTSLSPPDGSAQAQHCARFYPVAKRMMLEQHQWNFTTSRVSLAVLVDGYSDRWRYAYAVPADSTQIISVCPQTQYDAYLPFGLSLDQWFYSLAFDYVFDFEQNPFLDYELAVYSGQAVILSNAESAVARYSTLTVQAGQYSGLFTDALAHLLASMLAGPLLKGDVGAAESKRQLQWHQVAMSQAKTHDSQQRSGSQQPMPTWIAGRA